MVPGGLLSAHRLKTAASGKTEWKASKISKPSHVGTWMCPYQRIQYRKTSLPPKQISPPPMNARAATNCNITPIKTAVAAINQSRLEGMTGQPNLDWTQNVHIVKTENGEKADTLY
jgi:hypothetical protein